MTPRTILFYILLAAIPAFFVNKALQKWLKPKESSKNLVLYIVLVLVIAMIYAFIVCWALIKYLWLSK